LSPTVNSIGQKPGPVRSLSVLMPTWNGEAFLDRVLAALSGQDTSLPWTFLAVDSGSTDRTISILESWAARFPVDFRLHQIHQSAFDHGDTRNLLAAESAGDLLVFLTQDAIPCGPDWLSTLAGNFDDPKVGAAYCRNVPRPDAQLLTRVFSEGDPTYAIGRREQRKPDEATFAAMDPHERRLLFNCNNVAAAYRRALWERHPFPRTEFGEDVLMARGLIEAGYTVVYDDVATVEHSHDYGPEAMRARARIDGRFNVEWLERVCVASRLDAGILARRQIDRDRRALEAAGVDGEELSRQLRYAGELRRAAFVGLYEGGRSRTRRPRTRMIPRSTLRILYVVHGFPPDTWAGTEVYTLGLAQEMKHRGHEVAILTRAPAPASVAEGGPPDFAVGLTEFAGLPVWRMTHRLMHGNLRQSYHQPGAEAAFRQVVLKVRPDVVHFQHLIHLSASLPHICRELGVPSLITVNDYWALCSRVQMIRPDGVRCEENQGQGCLLCVQEKHYRQIPVARRLLPLFRPFVSVLHAGARVLEMPRLAEYADGFRDMGDRLDFTCGAYASCDLALAPSRFLRQKLLDTGKFDPHKVVYSDYGTLADDTSAIGGRAEQPVEPDSKVRFGYVGSLLWYKGVHVLLRAMQQLANRNVVLHVYGDFNPEKEPYHAELAELARACAGKVVFHGHFDNRTIARVYEQFDVLVVPSIWFENSPITIHESFLFETPVVTSNIGGMAELVRDGMDGLHFEVGDAHDLALKLARFCDQPGLRSRLSNFRHVKTMAEDAREMEVRYRALACIVRERRLQVLVDQPGSAVTIQGGPVERQGRDMALLRPGGAWVEYDVSLAGPGRVEVRLYVQVLASETDVPLGGSILLDDVEVGRIDPFMSAGHDEVRSFTFEIELRAPVRRLRINAGDVFLRVARIVVAELPGSGLMPCCWR
jgi:glycosyltransferase involved in cell wall biosynthesis